MGGDRTWSFDSVIDGRLEESLKKKLMFGIRACLWEVISHRGWTVLKN